MLLVLLSTFATADEQLRPQVWVDLEVIRRHIGTYILYPTAETPLSDAKELPCPTTNVVVGPLADGSRPFRTWTDIAFDGTPYLPFNGRHGVGFRLSLVWPNTTQPPTSATVGVNGSLSFDGTVTVTMGKQPPSTSELVWSRGFDRRPKGMDTHVDAYITTAMVQRSGTYGPYAWTIEGTMTADLHLWGL